MIDVCVCTIIQKSEVGIHSKACATQPSCLSIKKVQLLLVQITGSSPFSLSLPGWKKPLSIDPSSYIDYKVMFPIQEM